jgi:pimeloyl-ACP methyl ester carboxylesterase
MSLPSLRSSADDAAAPDDARNKRWIVGSVVAGAYLTGAALRWWNRRQLVAPESLPKAIDAEARTFELAHGRANFYVRPGTGTPVVLVHSFNAAASSYEMKPIFDHLAATTDRPLYAMDWLGFGRSARPDIDYRPVLFLRQLRRFLSEQVQEPADLIGLSLGAEYAARVTHTTPVLVRRLGLIHPTGLTADRGPSTAGRFFVRLAGRIGGFELLYYKLTRRASLRSFYDRQVFLESEAISDALLDYAHTTTHARGAHHAPLRFVDGTLFPEPPAQSIYARLYRPTLLLTPTNAAETIQGFEQVTDVLAQNARDLTHIRLPGGLLPQFEAPDALFDALDDFFTP